MKTEKKNLISIIDKLEYTTSGPKDKLKELGHASKKYVAKRKKIHSRLRKEHLLEKWLISQSKP